MTVIVLAVIEPLGISTVDVAHAPIKVPPRRLQQREIAHQTIAWNPESADTAGTVKRCNEIGIVLIIKKNRLATSPPVLRWYIHKSIGYAGRVTWFFDKKLIGKYQ